MTTLSLCMIARNEEAWIGKSLASVKNLVDEMIVLDTGSTDNTAQIAAQAGARVFHAPWENDFAKARNLSIEKATKDWILVLDADEVLDASAVARIRAILQNPAAPFYWLTQITYSDEAAVFGWKANALNLPESEGYPGYVESTLVRLFRNIPEIRFEGVIHEHANHRDASLKPATSGVLIHHYGKYKSQMIRAAKDELYLKLGLEKCERNPSEAQGWYELGVQYWGMNRLAEAKTMLERALKIKPRAVRTLVALAGIASSLNRPREAIAYYLNIIEINPTSDIPYLYLPTLLIDLGEISFAEEILKMGEAHVADQPVWHINRGVVAQTVGNHRLAVECFSKAGELNPRDGLSYINRGISYMQLKEWAKARVDLLHAAAIEKVSVKANRKMVEWFLKQGLWKESLEWIEDHLASLKTDPDLIYQQALAWLMGGNKARARSLLGCIPNPEKLPPDVRRNIEFCLKAATNDTGAVHQRKNPETETRLAAD